MNPKRSFEIHGLDEPRTFPTSDEIDWHIARSRQIRAEATAAMLRAAGRAVARPFRRLGAPISRWDRRQQAYQLLTRCSDRLLADIGIAREDIPLLVRGIDPHAADPAERSFLDGLRAIRVRRAALVRARREWRRIYDELMAYEDRELDDLGIRRIDIPAILKGRVPASAFD